MNLNKMIGHTRKKCNCTDLFRRVVGIKSLKGSYN